MKEERTDYAPASYALRQASIILDSEEKEKRFCTGRQLVLFDETWC
jgi:hypothetical protein